MFPSDETPAQRSMRGRMAVHRSWANTGDRTDRTSAGRAAFADRFEREVDPEGVLPPDERAQRAKAAKSAYFTALALKSSKSRGGGESGRTRSAARKTRSASR